jgi:hypothetical protein
MASRDVPLVLALASFLTALQGGGCSQSSDGSPPGSGGSGGSSAGRGGSSGRGGTGTGTGGSAGGTGGSSSASGGSAGAGTGGSAGSAGSTGSGGSSGAGGSSDASGAESGTGGTGGGSDAGTGMTPERGEVGAAGFPGWKYVKPIKLDTAAAGVAGAVTNYPVPVMLNAMNFDFAQAKPLGEDLRFGKADGTPLPYSIELFDAGAKVAAIWVKVDQIAGNNATQSINMYWGNATAGDAGSSAAVFSMQEGFAGVWHLNEEGNVMPGGYKDSSSAGNHGTGQGGLAAGARVDARIGKGTKTLNAMDQWIQVEDTSGKFRTMQITASIWGRADSFPGRSGPGGYDTIFSSGEYWTIQKIGRSAVFEACYQHTCALGETPIPVNTWHLFHTVRTGNSHRFYVDGKEEDMKGVATRADFKPLGIGNQTQYLMNAGEKRSWNGTLDEARVLTVAKDGNWIKLDFESQKEGSKFLVFGETQTR